MRRRPSATASNRTGLAADAATELGPMIKLSSSLNACSAGIRLPGLTRAAPCASSTAISSAHRARTELDQRGAEAARRRCGSPAMSRLSLAAGRFEAAERTAQAAREAPRTCRSRLRSWRRSRRRAALLAPLVLYRQANALQTNPTTCWYPAARLLPAT
jgi:hypothetical protein